MATVHSSGSVIERRDRLRRSVENAIAEKQDGQFVADLFLLRDLLRGEVPVGGNQYPPEKVNEMPYEVKRQRDVLIAAFQKISRWCDGEDQPGQIVYEIERIIGETRTHVLFREHPADAQSYADLAASGGIVEAP